MKFVLSLLFPISLAAMQHWDGKAYKDNCAPQVKAALELLATLNTVPY